MPKWKALRTTAIASDVGSSDIQVPPNPTCETSRFVRPSRRFCKNTPQAIPEILRVPFKSLRLAKFNAPSLRMRLRICLGAMWNS